MDELTLHELARLEAERKLTTLPAAVLESAWVREAQIEAVIDAVLVVGLGHPAAIAEARHTGEWCARIAGSLAEGPDPALARRAGVLSTIDAAKLEQIPELRHIAEKAQKPLIAAIVEVARDFASRIAPDADDRAISPRVILRAMSDAADARTQPIIEALQTALVGPRHARVA